MASHRIIKRYRQACKILKELEQEGHRVEKVKEYVWRLNDLEVYPARMRFKRGHYITGYTNLRDLAKL